MQASLPPNCWAATRSLGMALFIALGLASPSACLHALALVVLAFPLVKGAIALSDAVTSDARPAPWWRLSLVWGIGLSCGGLLAVLAHALLDTAWEPFRLAGLGSAACLLASLLPARR